MKLIFINIILLIPNIKCTNIEARDGKTFPNGTIVGSYIYIDAQGNQVNVKYFADEKSYSIDLRAYKMPSEDENDETVRNSYGNVEPTTEPSADTMVPLKLDFPDIENIYTIENPQIATKEIETNNKENRYSNDNEDQNEDYGIYDSAKKAPPTKRYRRNKRIKCNKVVKKIRQTLDTLIKGIPYR